MFLYSTGCKDNRLRWPHPIRLFDPIYFPLVIIRGKIGIYRLNPPLICVEMQVVEWDCSMLIKWLPVSISLKHQTAQMCRICSEDCQVGSADSRTTTALNKLQSFINHPSSSCFILGETHTICRIETQDRTENYRRSTRRNNRPLRTIPGSSWGDDRINFSIKSKSRSISEYR